MNISNPPTTAPITGDLSHSGIGVVSLRSVTFHRLTYPTATLATRRVFVRARAVLRELSDAPNNRALFYMNPGRSSPKPGCGSSVSFGSCSGRAASADGDGRG